MENRAETSKKMISQKTLTLQERTAILNKLRRGVAKLGIALVSGPRGLGFESRHSDHKIGLYHCDMARFSLRTDSPSKTTGCLCKELIWEYYLSNAGLVR